MNNGRYYTIPQDKGKPLPIKAAPAKRSDARVISTVPSALFSVMVHYDGSLGDAYLLIFDSSDYPPDGSLPSLPPIPVGGGNSFTHTNISDGVEMSKGITLALSSTPDTLTKLTGGGVFNATHLPLEL